MPSHHHSAGGPALQPGRFGRVWDRVIVAILQCYVFYLRKTLFLNSNPLARHSHAFESSTQPLAQRAVRCALLQGSGRDAPLEWAGPEPLRPRRRKWRSTPTSSTLKGTRSPRWACPVSADFTRRGAVSAVKHPCIFGFRRSALVSHRLSMSGLLCGTPSVARLDAPRVRRAPPSWSPRGKTLWQSSKTLRRCEFSGKAHTVRCGRSTRGRWGSQWP